MCLGDGGASTAQAEAERQRAEEEARQGRIREGRENIDAVFDQYDPAFYAERRQNYLDYATPQLEDQFADASRALTLALARNGMMNSSVRARRFGDLEKEYDKNATAIADKGREYANTTRAAIDAAKADLMTQNTSLADPLLIAQQAQARAISAAELPAYSPLGTLFAGVTSGLATQRQLEERGLSRYDTPLFNSSGSARIVT